MYAVGLGICYIAIMAIGGWVGMVAVVIHLVVMILPTMK
jgi:hypothetical protein